MRLIQKSCEACVFIFVTKVSILFYYKNNTNVVFFKYHTETPNYKRYKQYAIPHPQYAPLRYLNLSPLI